MRGVPVPHAAQSRPRFQHATPAFRTFCGQDALAALPRELDRLGASHAVIVCAPWVRDHPHVLAAIGEALGARLAGCFDGVQDHSPVPAVEEARRTLEDARADAVVAVGGGSAIVTARAATILLAERRPVRDLCTRREPDGRLTSPRLAAPKIPNWVVPTTPITAYAKAGSAVRDPDTGERLALFDPKTRAQGIFLDPALVLTAPAGLASSAALNAFAMAVESLQACADDPLAEALLAHALRMLTRWLPRLHAAPGDAEPRLRLMLAALLCGQGSDYVGGGLAQALSHAAGPRSSVSNGVIEALLLPYTMRFNAPVTGAGLALIAETLDSRPPAPTAADTQAITAVERFLAGAGVPARLRDVGLTAAALTEVADHAMADWAISQVPRPVARPQLDELLNAAW
jgi:alcohol dehydrogenase class IV